MVSHSLPRRDKALPRQNQLLGTRAATVLRKQPVPPLPIDRGPNPSDHSPRKCSSLLVPRDRRSRSSNLALPLTSLCSKTSHGIKCAANGPHSRGRPPHPRLHRHTIRNGLKKSPTIS